MSRHSRVNEDAGTRRRADCEGVFERYRSEEMRRARRERDAKDFSAEVVAWCVVICAVTVLLFSLYRLCTA